MMSGILDILSSEHGKQLIDGTSNQLGINRSNVASALGTIIPLILGGMKNNASTSDGASGLLGALGNPRHGGGILDNLGSILGGDKIDDEVMNDGGNILGHIFGGQQENAANAIGKSRGIDMGAAMSLMKTAAPFIMGYLGKKAMSNGVSDQNGLNGLLGNILGDDNDKNQDLASKLQGFDQNDLSVDDLAGLMNGESSGGGILDALKKLFS